MSITLSVEDARLALDFYVAGFAAQVVGEVVERDGMIGYAPLSIAGGHVVLAEWTQDFAPVLGTTPPLRLGGSSVLIDLAVDDVDAWHARALAAGATTVIAPTDEFFGRRGKVRDPFGHVWSFVKRAQG